MVSEADTISLFKVGCLGCIILDMSVPPAASELSLGCSLLFMKHMRHAQISSLIAPRFVACSFKGSGDDRLELTHASDGWLGWCLELYSSPHYFSSPRSDINTLLLWGGVLYTPSSHGAPSWLDAVKVPSGREYLSLRPSFSAWTACSWMAVQPLTKIHRRCRFQQCLTDVNLVCLLFTYFKSSSLFADSIRISHRILAHPIHIDTNPPFLSSPARFAWLLSLLLFAGAQLGLHFRALAHMKKYCQQVGSLQWSRASLLLRKSPLSPYPTVWTFNEHVPH